MNTNFDEMINGNNVPLSSEMEELSIYNEEIED